MCNVSATPPRRHATEQRDERAPLHCLMPPVLSTDRIAHLGTAGDCCAAAFQSSLFRFSVACPLPSGADKVDSAEGMATLEAMSSHHNFRPGQQNKLVSEPPIAAPDEHAQLVEQFPPSDGDCHTPLPREVRKSNHTTPRACSLHVQGGQDAGCCHPASGSKAERPSFPLCPRKWTYLPILERIPLPALGERCHRLETPPPQVAAEERCSCVGGASPTIDPLFRESYPENLRRKPTSRYGRKQMKTQTKTGLATGNHALNVRFAPKDGVIGLPACD